MFSELKHDVKTKPTQLPLLAQCCGNNLLHHQIFSLNSFCCAVKIKSNIIQVLPVFQSRVVYLENTLSFAVKLHYI